MKLSVVVPMFNEEGSIELLLQRLMKSIEELSSDVEILVIDDGSTDRSREIVKGVASKNLELLSMERNSGKGAAVRFGISHAAGDLILVQDADLEYDTSDIGRMLAKYEAFGEVNIAVFGSRVQGARVYLEGWRGMIGLWPGQGLPQRVFNFVLSLFHFLVSWVWVSDLLTGYKIYPRRIFDEWQTVTSGFETDHEITMQLHKLKMEIVEVPVSYTPRSKLMGKKITGRDAIKALQTIWRFRK